VTIQQHLLHGPRLRGSWRVLAATLEMIAGHVMQHVQLLKLNVLQIGPVFRRQRHDWDQTLVTKYCAPNALAG
jgi:hypothetical protein